MNLTKKMKTRCVTMDQNKLNRVLESMKETGIEQLLISDPASINYLTGRYVNCMERMQVLYLDVEGITNLLSESYSHNLRWE